jgi:hypothetical protein
MKYLIFLFLHLMAVSEELPELDPDKPIYQKQWGGVVIAWPFGDVDEVRMPDPKTKEQAQLEAEIAIIKAETEAEKRKIKEDEKNRAHGYLWIKIGAGLFVIGAFAFVALIKAGMEYIGVLVAVSGLAGVCYGALVVKLAGMETIIAWGAVALIVTILAAWFCKGNSLYEKIIGHIEKRKT